MWCIDRIVSKGDYNYAVVKNHPNATKNGYVLEHRIVVENSLGRVLLESEIVHHINGIKKDNRIENLVILNSKEHQSIHGKEKGKRFVVLICPNCKRVFERERRQTHLAKNKTYTTCSASCRGSFSRKVQLDKVDLNLEIENNILFNYIVFSV